MFSIKTKLGIQILITLSLVGLGVYGEILCADRKNVVIYCCGGFIGDAAINYGSVSNSSGPDHGRECVGELGPVKSGESSANSALHGNAAEAVPRQSSRIFTTDQFRYTFPVNPGQKILSLHFYPASHHGLEKQVDRFIVKKNGPFSLLRDYNIASVAACTLDVNRITKEFDLSGIKEGNQSLTLQCFQSFFGKTSKMKTYAFVNGTGNIFMPTGFYYAPEHEFGGRIASPSTWIYSTDFSTALEVIHGLNIGGNSIIDSMEDVEMFRPCDEDTGNSFLQLRGQQLCILALQFYTKNITALAAPAKTNRTSWKTDTGRVSLTSCYSTRFIFNYRTAENTVDEIFNLSDPENILAESILSAAELLLTHWGLKIKYSSLAMRKRNVSRTQDWSQAFSFPCIYHTHPWTGNIPYDFLLNGSFCYVLGDHEVELFVIISIGFGVCNLLWLIWKWIHNEKCAKSAFSSASVESSCRCFSLAEIKSATEDFSEAFVIGNGGFGKVYKGTIPGIVRNSTVAIKRLNPHSKQGHREFWAEIETLSKLHHTHLVSLVGYCNERKEMIVVYEYIPGGTLADNLYKFAENGKPDLVPLSWEQRLRICIGAARGLEYLHTSGEHGVIHRDIKDTNILLDENLIAKISDFGLSKLKEITDLKSYISTRVKGTFGYLDPDYVATQRLTIKTDVYSFGIMMLVVLSGKPAATRTENLGEPAESLLSLFRECMADDRDVIWNLKINLVDPTIMEEISLNSLRKFVEIIEICLKQLPTGRPTMDEVVSSLEQALEQHIRNHHCMSTPLVDGIAVGRPEEKNVQLSHSSPNEAKMLKGCVKTAEGYTERQKKNLARKTGEENLLRTGGKDIARRSLLRAWTKKSARDSDSNPPYEFTLDELKAITKHYKQDYINIGTEGSGNLYKCLLSEDRIKKRLQPVPVAIRVFNAHKSCQTDQEWLAEVKFLGQLSHPNLTKLVGYCCEDGHRALIYENTVQGSLENNLFSSVLTPLPWSTRMKIAYAAAKGLAFLHEAKIPVIYRDFKASNILLDSGYNAKLSDFVLATDGVLSVESISVPITAADVDAAPEFIVRGRLTTKTDVYNYGEVLLEILTGRCAFDRSKPLGEQYLANWALPFLRVKKHLGTILDPRIGDYPMKDAHQVAMLAYDCLNASPNERPSMKDVVKFLEPFHYE